MSETFREFFVRRNGMTVEVARREEITAFFTMMAETMMDWMDELAARVQGDDSVPPVPEHIRTNPEVIAIFKRLAEKFGPS